ncbi:hypothetical protein GRJ2_001703300 [Grus japonensis]|uniref:Uncharacterized protein n=1 Tax=Grus japonensis TaxID=30415 RepID=A0ABC9X418_GRUJA
MVRALVTGACGYGYWRALGEGDLAWLLHAALLLGKKPTASPATSTNTPYGVPSEDSHLSSISKKKNLLDGVKDQGEYFPFRAQLDPAGKL